MTLPTFQGVGTAGATVGGAGDTVPTWPTHQADDVGLLFVETASETVSAPSGWVEVTGSPQANGGGTTKHAVFWKRATSASETDPVIPDPGNHCYAIIATFRGCKNTGDPYNISAGNNANATTAISFPDATTTVADCLVVHSLSWGVDNAGPLVGAITNAALANITERSDAGSVDGDGGGIGIVTGEKASAGAIGASTGTLGASSSQARMTIALAPLATNNGAAAVTLGALTVAAEGDISGGLARPDFADADELLSTMLEGMILRNEKGLV